MKRIYLLILASMLSVFYSFNKAPMNDDYSNLTSIIKNKNAQFLLEDKLLLVTFWSSNNAESREMNKEALRVYKIYKYAKLKGGVKGVSLFTVSSDSDKKNWEIALNRDNLNDETNHVEQKGLNSDLFKALKVNQVPFNILYDSNGNELARNITSEGMFKYFNSLVTR